MNKILNISLIGFSGADQGRFEKIFQYSANRERSYRVGEPPEVLVVNGDNPDGMQEGARVARNAALPLVIVARSLPEGLDAHHIVPPLMTGRVLRVLDQVEAPAGQDEATILKESTQPDAEDYRYRALVVDDSLAMRESLKQELAALPVPVKVDFAQDGEQALARVAQANYDLVFLDIVMPGIDGYEVCKRMRAKPGFRKTPIVMLSGKNSPLDEVKGIIAGASTYLTKPIAHEAFQKVLHRVVRWLDCVDA